MALALPFDCPRNSTGGAYLITQSISDIPTEDGDERSYGCRSVHFSLSSG
jgi:hypothetical protein